MASPGWAAFSWLGAPAISTGRIPPVPQ